MSSGDDSFKRAEYERNQLAREALKACPTAQLRSWIDEAVAACALEPYAMVLATAHRNGRPSSRAVLLKQLSDAGLVFFTHDCSRKSRELTENPYASVTFLWMELERQVIVEGGVERVDRLNTENYFHSRPRGAQLGCWASQQDSEIEGREVLDRAYTEAEKRFAGREIPCPRSWGGWCLLPFRFEFWQGRPHRLHDRFVYECTEKQWQIKRLSP